MKKKILLSFILVCINIFTLSNMSVLAESGIKYGDYLYYTETNGEIEITDCDEIATAVEIPSEIDGKKVTAIGDLTPKS